MHFLDCPQHFAFISLSVFCVVASPTNSWVHAFAIETLNCVAQLTPTAHIDSHIQGVCLSVQRHKLQAQHIYIVASEPCHSWRSAAQPSEHIIVNWTQLPVTADKLKWKLRSSLRASSEKLNKNEKCPCPLWLGQEYAYKTTATTTTTTTNSLKNTLLVGPVSKTVVAQKMCLAVCEMSFVKCTLCQCLSVCLSVCSSVCLARCLLPLLFTSMLLMCNCHRHAGEFV